MSNVYGADNDGNDDEQGAIFDQKTSRNFGLGELKI